MKFTKKTIGLIMLIAGIILIALSIFSGIFSSVNTTLVFFWLSIIINTVAVMILRNNNADAKKGEK